MVKQMKVAEYIDAQLRLCGKSQKQVAEEVGFPKANMLTMIKKGLTRVPLARANKLADALGINRAAFMKRLLAEYHPEILEAIEEALGEVQTSEQ